MFNQLTTMEQWRVLKFRSGRNPVLILKHSNASPNSAAALQKIRDAQAGGLIADKINLVVVQENREISNTIEKELDILHQSPQLIVMKDAKPVYSADGEQINIKAAAKALEQN